MTRRWCSRDSRPLTALENAETFPRHLKGRIDLQSFFEMEFSRHPVAGIVTRRSQINVRLRLVRFDFQHAEVLLQARSARLASDGRALLRQVQRACGDLVSQRREGR